jgi:hypothetical protein
MVDGKKCVFELVSTTFERTWFCNGKGILDIEDVEVEVTELR